MIDTLDLSGVALAAIRGLSDLAKAQAAQIAALTARLEEVELSLASV